MPKRTMSELTVHPFNMQVYGEPDSGLKDNLDQFGLEYPIEIDTKGRILSGARRWKAAKELGWRDIEVRVFPSHDEGAARKHILLANNYRDVKTVHVRQKEADAYREFLTTGEMTKEELASLARQKGKAPSRDEDLRPQRLAASAAGISPSTYQQATYVTDPSRGEAEIDQAKQEGLIAAGQSSSLKRDIRKGREAFKRDRLSADRAAGEARARLREAKLRHGYSEDEQRQRRAQEVAIDVIRKGRSFVTAIDGLRHDVRAKHLGAREAFILAGIVYEAKQSLESLARKAKLELPAQADELERYAHLEDAEVEIVG